MATANVPRTGFGSLLRSWRTARRMSQQQLALESEVSTRHISFVENGKSAPSREMVLILSSALDLPLRERNALLTAAGFAAVYRESNLEAPEMLRVRQAFDTILGHHEPFPAIVIDRGWNLIRANEAFTRLLAFFFDAPPSDPLIMKNVMHAFYHPEGVRPFVENWAEVAGILTNRLYRESLTELEESESKRLLDALRTYPGVSELIGKVDLGARPEVTATLRLRKGDVALSMFTMLTTLGTPMDITAQELRIESYFPADEATAAWLARS